jgi:hypothetical protein
MEVMIAILMADERAKWTRAPGGGRLSRTSSTMQSHAPPQTNLVGRDFPWRSLGTITQSLVLELLNRQCAANRSMPGEVACKCATWRAGGTQMQPEESQDSYTISQNTFGTYEVLIKFASGDERRQGRFLTEAAARAWIGERKGSVTSPRIPVVAVHQDATSPV